jgi:hypothetical protein
LHVSAPLHALLSLHDVPSGTGVCETPVAELHASVVHGLPSSTVGGVPATHTADALHVSAPLHALLSLHDVPAATGVCETPVAGSHASVVHGLPSSTVGGVPATQLPDALHVSAPLHALLSLHDVPAATGVCVTPVAGLHASVVHGLPSSTVGGVPATQVPDALHVSAPLHALPSEHALPFATGVCVHAPEAQASVVQGFASSHEAGHPEFGNPSW